jgi:nucleoside-diphosphate-sugar epimerase
MPKPLAQLMMPVIGLFMPPMREITENIYMFYEPYVVDHSTFDAAFGDELKPTPLQDAIQAIVQWYRENPAG